ncbi:MAG: hypothetical protein F9K40_14150 [Kofleriaceae bacterium]|nr:MAG: hypothetical protein F9K40_14150 [Kofleriaceae bacterium]MBZ0232174.1 hypothetical protein [Kofleriaceae bacterium]
MRTPRYLSCVVLVAACGSKPERARLESVVEQLCGDRYRRGGSTQGSGEATSGCEPASDAETGVFARLEGDARRLTVQVRGDVERLPAMVEQVIASVAPLLNPDQRAVVAEELPMLVPDRYRPFERVVDGVAISAATWTRDRPWERYARLTVRFGVPVDADPKPPQATSLAVLGERYGWRDRLGVVDADTLAAWSASCAGDWTSGDVWARCEAAALTFWAEWVPTTRRLLRMHVETSGDLGVVERLVSALLTEEQRATVRAGLAADLDNASDDPEIHVRSSHHAARRTITIAAEPR